ncbi:MAG: helix-turn-helix transcriptional regulator [Solirubrobacteraceae bacterium]
MPPRRQSTPRSAEHAALGEAIRLARVERGLSQEALADAVPMHVTYLGGLERGVRNPSYDSLVRLARALKLAPGALVARADELLKTQS